MAADQRSVETQESLLVRYLGYIRPPALFRRKFGTAKNYPEPTARYVVDEEKREVRLTYIFPLGKLASANKKNKSRR